VLRLLTLGATVQRLEVTCGDGVRRNVVLGRPTPADYLAGSDYRGATIGRYANRIAGGRFLLDDRLVQVATNDGGNSLHGGPDGFDRREWTVVEESAERAVLEIVSSDGDQGFPGKLTARVRFEVSDDAVEVDFEATTDATTVVNLTSHAYFNLDGNGAGTIDDQLLTVFAERYTPSDAHNIPLGEHADVAGTPYDFRQPMPIRATRIDHNYVVDGAGLRPAAVLESPRTRTRLELSTDQPGLQVYTGDFLDDEPRLGVALEPQLFPDSPNHPEWPSPVLSPGKTYRAQLRWSFEAVRSPRPRSV
jgi:aldose 1-epimerase